ncbi:hypothetical protein [Nocardia brasiliensis]|uniref:hypothetical protein n=1 Tax=Nocardia brasiliensis TaxID=37326 RepID=UPI00114CDFEA|nr:hypothetical protein [Nocardia brasiliensis]
MALVKSTGLEVISGTFQPVFDGSFRAAIHGFGGFTVVGRIRLWVARVRDLRPWLRADVNKPGRNTDRPFVGYSVEHFGALLIRHVKRIVFCNNLHLTAE